jgi:transcriptional regulator with XRE-family HTH domain
MSEAANYAIQIIKVKLVIPRMAELDLSQSKLAKASGVSQSQISDWLSGRSDITLTKFIKILTALQINIQFVHKEDDTNDYSQNTIHFN